MTTALTRRVLQAGSTPNCRCLCLALCLLLVGYKHLPCAMLKAGRASDGDDGVDARGRHLDRRNGLGLAVAPPLQLQHACRTGPSIASWHSRRAA